MLSRQNRFVQSRRTVKATELEVCATQIAIEFKRLMIGGDGIESRALAILEPTQLEEPRRLIRVSRHQRSITRSRGFVIVASFRGSRLNKEPIAFWRVDGEQATSGIGSINGVAILPHQQRGAALPRLGKRISRIAASRVGECRSSRRVLESLVRVGALFKR